MGIVTGENVAASAGKGAAAGAAAGATIGGLKGYSAGDARREVINDLREKSLQARPLVPKTLSYGVLFFPGEAKSAKSLRMQVVESDTGSAHVLILHF